MSLRNLLFAAALASAPLLAAGAASAQALAGADRAQAVRTVSQAVNAVRGLQGRFIQTNPDRTTVGGAFWLSRPGKVRFEYDAPSPLLMVSDGRTVSLQDRRLRTTDRYPLRQTPLYFLLKADVDLERDVIVSSVERRDGALFVTMRDRRREADGDLTVAFDERTRALEEWTVRDRQGRQTRVRLTNVQPNARMAASLFATPGADRRFNPSGGR